MTYVNHHAPDHTHISMTHLPFCLIHSAHSSLFCHTSSLSKISSPPSRQSPCPWPHPHHPKWHTYPSVWSIQLTAFYSAILGVCPKYPPHRLSIIMPLTTPTSQWHTYPPVHSAHSSLFCHTWSLSKISSPPSVNHHAPDHTHILNDTPTLLSIQLTALYSAILGVCPK